jgi:bifunctional enzyme CysN/CysC
MADGPITKSQRAAQKGQLPACIWLTGLPGAGKSTIAQALDADLFRLGRHVVVLDGDLLRTGLNRDLGFTHEARAENIRRAAEVARLMVEAGLVVVCAFISPYRTERRFARSLFEPGEFLEVYLDVTTQICESRDPKGHYAKARRGEIKGFTGIDGSYEPPEAPELRLNTALVPLDGCVERILDALAGRAPVA